MIVLYNRDKFPNEITKSIFLAGPNQIVSYNEYVKANDIKETEEIADWRYAALKILEEMNYDGVVVLPLDKPNAHPTYEELSEEEHYQQCEWERKCMDACDAIVMYIPRDEVALGLTTNIEFGMYYDSKKIFLAIPDDAYKCEYISEIYRHGMSNDRFDYPMNISENLEDAIKEAVAFAEPTFRQNEEVYVPSYIFNNTNFQDWYRSNKLNGNEITSFKTKFVLTSRDRQPFIYAVMPEMYIMREKRRKLDEVLFSRPDISSLVIYSQDRYNILDSKVMMIKEYRVNARNSESMIYEIPSGSIDTENALNNSLKELKEETGLDILSLCDKYSFIPNIRFIGDRQCSATFAIHKNNVYAMEILPEMMTEIEEETANKIYGVKIEWTYVKIMTLREILNGDVVDWSNMGIIQQAILLQ